ASGRHYGFTAQELEEVFPELVSTEAHPPEDEKGEPLIYKSINYIEMIPILTQAIQEQQEEIEDLKKELGK
ncbi:MAG: tail fiber domain-containing protein, partial [Bacteroidales bacterium]|nr:tail fiber domain-containing protein [Bacteroidales bacterium]